MFKRLRDGLLGRIEPDQQEIEQTTVSPEADETDETDETVEATDADDSNLSPSVETPPAALTSSVPGAPAPAIQEAESEASPDQGLDDHSESDTGDLERRGFFRNPFKFSLGKTRQLFGQINASFDEADDITETLWDELEETLITADVGVQTTESLMDTLRERVQAEGLTRGSELRDALKEELEILLGDP
ncbi:MAG TPA: signal recognition particle receptor subunit alpha, partial [Ktedonobacterales bacterium]